MGGAHPGAGCFEFLSASDLGPGGSSGDGVGSGGTYRHHLVTGATWCQCQPPASVHAPHPSQPQLTHSTHSQVLLPAASKLKA